MLTGLNDTTVSQPLHAMGLCPFCPWMMGRFLYPQCVRELDKRGYTSFQAFDTDSRTICNLNAALNARVNGFLLRKHSLHNANGCCIAPGERFQTDKLTTGRRGFAAVGRLEVCIDRSKLCIEATYPNSVSSTCG